LVFIAPKHFNYLAFPSFGYECTWWMLFQKRVGHTKIDIYVFIYVVCVIVKFVGLLSEFPWQRAVANTEATEPSIPIGLVEVITSTVIGRHYDMVNGNGIRNICVTNDYGYHSFVI